MEEKHGVKKVLSFAGKKMDAIEKFQSNQCVKIRQLARDQQK